MKPRRRVVLSRRNSIYALARPDKQILRGDELARWNVFNGKAVCSLPASQCSRLRPALFAAHKSVQEAGAKCKFFVAPEQVIRILKRAQLDKVFESFQDEASAMFSFGLDTS